MTSSSGNKAKGKPPARTPASREASGGGERRTEARRKPASNRNSAGLFKAAGNPVTARFLISRDWIFLVPVMLLGMVMHGLGIGGVPELDEMVLAGVAMAIVAATPLLAWIEREVAQSLTQRLGLMCVAVVLPMLMYGYAIADWSAESGAEAWMTGVGVLAIVAAFSSVLLTGRLTSIVASAFALWFPAVIGSWSLETLLMMAIAAGGATYTIRRQMRADRAAAQHRQAMERRQARAEEMLSDYEQTRQGWFWETDRRGLITYVSHTVGELLGVSGDDLIGKPFQELFIVNADTQESERTLNFHLTARSSFSELAVRAAVRDEERWWSISGRPVHDSYKNFIGFRGSGNDLTEKRRSQEHATRLAHYDSLTGLANRLQMAQTLEKILGSLRPDQRTCAVFLLDLDRFKQVNDTMGHPVGDALLKQVAQRLERTVGEGGRVGRLGGDEFEVVLPGASNREDLAALATRVIENLSQPYVIEGHRVMIGASVGIALAPDDGVTSEAIIRNADLALYAAKDGGRGRHHFYAADLHSDAEERRRLEQDLRDAISHGGLELYYQPVVHTTTEKITGFEALLRWTHPVHGPMSPAKFIPIAEDAGLIAPIGEWALRTACDALAHWPPSVRVAVNVSPLQFANPALPSIVTSALASAQVHPSRLELEITESVFLNDDEGTEAMFAALKRVGVRLALDDFGTGYSSLGYLKKAPFDKIKIDQSFVRGATVKGSRNGAIISSIVSLAESLGMETTAEGVETLDELDLVRMLGCSHIQGYIYEKPLNTDQATARLHSGLNAIAQGPRSARSQRQTMLRKILLEHNGERYSGTIRNISQTGALVEGLWNVPVGTIFGLVLSEGHVITATARWCQEDRMGVEFATPLPLDDSGRVNLLPGGGVSRSEAGAIIRKAG